MYSPHGPQLADLPLDALEVALNASEALLMHKYILRRKGLFLMLVTRFRDDTRAAIGMEPERYPGRVTIFTSLDDLASFEFEKVAGSVTTLLKDEFVNVMDDPELPRLLREFKKELDAQREERADLQASIAS